MSLLLSKISMKSNSITKSGSYPAIINLIAYTGTNNTTNYGELPQITFGFTTNNLQSIYKVYTVSSYELSSLYKDLKAICGNENFMAKNFDLFSLLRTPVLLDVTMTESNKSFPIIEKIYQSSQQFDTRNIQFIKFSFDEPDDFHNLPKWIKIRIKTSKECPVFSDLLYVI